MPDIAGMARKTFFTVGYERTTLAGLIAPRCRKLASPA